MKYYGLSQISLTNHPGHLDWRARFKRDIFVNAKLEYKLHGCKVRRLCNNLSNPNRVYAKDFILDCGRYGFYIKDIYTISWRDNYRSIRELTDED